LIVDDERLARLEIVHLLKEHPWIQVCGEAESVSEAAGLIANQTPDLIFLDVRMPGESGFDLLERARVSAHVIFVTAYDEFAIRAFEVNALDYLLKPVNPERLRSTLSRVVAQSKQQATPPRELQYDDSIFLTVDQSPRFVKLSSLVCIQADGDYTCPTATSGRLGMVLKSLREWERVLPGKQFCRVHRSCIINCEHVLRFENWFNDAYRVHLRNVEEPIVMSRRRAAGFRQRFGF
jgi:two-component system LytT family response regulator